jgi:uncharacterized membrane protein YphA (DoxX/SURF4 family)
VKSNCSPFRLCCCAVFFVVLLRIAIGWHFFYEGIHKFDPAAEFSAEGFLGIAKGPTAELYYWMLPDPEGLQRIEIATVKDKNDKDRDTFIVYENAWNAYFADYKKKYPNVKEDEATVIFDRYLESLRAGATDVKKDIEAFLASRDRFVELRKNVPNDASFEQQRRWDQMMGYRREAAAWTRMLNNMGNGLQSDLGRLADPELAGQKGQIVTAPEKALIPPNDYVQMQIPANRFVKSRMDALDLSVMFGLSAIGLCMMLGFCNRLACLGGAAFLVNVVLTTFPVPGVYPAIPTMVGNFMFVSKDVVELAALLFLMSIPAGRWGGLDYFLWHCGGKQIVGTICPFCRAEETKQA